MDLFRFADSHHLDPLGEFCHSSFCYHVDLLPMQRLSRRTRERLSGNKAPGLGPKRSIMSLCLRPPVSHSWEATCTT